jgi:flagellar hook-associated protein 1 FlgK
VSNFATLNTARTALSAQQRGVDVTGQNIANVNTDGYSRQRAELKAMGGSTVPAFFSTSTGIGQGVDVETVTRIRDAFLEGRGHLEHSTNARLNVENQAIELVEQAFREPGTTGIQSQAAAMWQGWGDVGNQPQDLAARSQVLQRLETLVGGFHASQGALDAQWNQTRENLDVVVRDVNAAATSIGELNLAIKRATQIGLPANELTDRRDALVMTLAEKVGATVRPGEFGAVDVLVGGVTLVSDSTVSKLKVAGSTDPADPTGATTVPPVGSPRIVTGSGNYGVQAGGEVSGQLSTLNAIIPGFRDKLDALAQQLATTLNAQHTAGFDLDGNPGLALLDSSAGPITASSLRVAVTDPRQVAASAVPPDANGPALDNDNADKLFQLRLSTTGVDANYRQMIVELGVQGAVAKRNVEIQQVVTTQVDNSRDSVAGVNLDEEMTNMMSYQHAYSAASRLVTAVDEMLDQLINRTGIVGR